MTPPNEHSSEGGRDDRGVPYHAESTLSSAQVLKARVFSQGGDSEDLIDEAIDTRIAPQSYYCSGPLSLRTLVPSLMMPALGSPSGDRDG